MILLVVPILFSLEIVDVVSENLALIGSNGNERDDEIVNAIKVVKE